MANATDLNSINDATGFANGDTFSSENEVRNYFTVESMELMGLGGGADQNELDAMARLVIENEWHCDFPARRVDNSLSNPAIVSIISNVKSQIGFIDTTEGANLWAKTMDNILDWIGSSCDEVTPDMVEQVSADIIEEYAEKIAEIQNA